AKLSGSGNDFLCIDNRDGALDEILDSPGRIVHFASSLCSRGKGVGADGVIFACTPDIEGVSDIAARFFEADGSEVELCGNGTACFIHWVRSSGWVGEGETKVLASAGVVRGTNSDGKYVRVCIPDPQDLLFDFELTVDDSSCKCDFAVTGVPHVITYVEDVNEVDIEHWGPVLRHHPHFAPRGTNANFVQIISPGELAVRTWEFGVEGETLSCGTGAAAAGILAALHFEWDKEYLSSSKPVLIHARSGDVLRVYFNLQEDNQVTDVCLETVVRFCCCGRVHPDLLATALQGQDSQTHPEQT
ncbi:MAG: diaminopimelate epimerase, partial [Planctomycetota bacterium]